MNWFHDLNMNSDTQFRKQWSKVLCSNIILWMFLSEGTGMSEARCSGFGKELNTFISVYFSSFSVSFLAQWVLHGPASNEESLREQVTWLPLSLVSLGEHLNKRMFIRITWDPSGFRWSLRFCVSDQLPGDAGPLWREKRENTRWNLLFPSSSPQPHPLTSLFSFKVILLSCHWD